MYGKLARLYEMNLDKSEFMARFYKIIVENYNSLEEYKMESLCFAFFQELSHYILDLLAINTFDLVLRINKGIRNTSLQLRFGSLFKQEYGSYSFRELFHMFFGSDTISESMQIKNTSREYEISKLNATLEGYQKFIPLLTIYGM